MLNIRNRFISLTLRLAALIAISILFGFYLNSISRFVTGFMRFEVQVGVLYIITLALEVLFNLIDMRHGIKGYPAGVYMPFKLSVTTYAIMASGLYLALTFSTIANEKNPEGFSYAICLLLFAVLDWILFDEKGTVKYGAAAALSIFPVFYMVFCMIRPHIFTNTPMYDGGLEYPYFFLDPKQVSMPILSIAIVVVLIVALFFFIVLLNNIFSGKYRKRSND